MRQRFCAMLVHAAAVCLIATPAYAALDADFNGDGVPDRIVLPRPPETSIVVRISGSAPQVLKFPGRLISIVATDVDHDGDLDLSALSERRGVLVWLNKGGHGRLKALKRKFHRHGFSLETSGPLASAPRQLSDRPVTQGVQDDRGRPAHDVFAAHVSVPDISTHLPHIIPFGPPADRGGASSSRAPPPHAVA